MPPAARTKAQSDSEINLGIRPHGGTSKMPGGQKLLIRLALTHFCTICIVGRSWGKTLGVAFLLVYEAFLHKGYYTAAYCAPTYKVAVPVYRMFKAVLRPLTKRASDNELTLELHPFGRNTGVTFNFWSLEKYDNLRFFRLNRAVIDEGADVHEDAVFRVIVPMFANRGGKLLVIGTPKRRGIGSVWMHRLWSMGVDPNEPDYAAMQGPSHGNPFLWGPLCKDPKELPRLIKIVQARGGDKAYREEILAEWIEDEGAVFTNLARTFSLTPINSPFTLTDKLWIGEEPDTGETAPDGQILRYPDPYAFAVDFGQQQDYTVGAMVNRRTRKLAAIYRMHLRGAPYHSVIPDLHQLRTRYNESSVYFDETGGHGGSVIEWMQARYKDSCIGVNWNTYNKERHISMAQRLCERAGENEDVVGPAWALLDIPWLRAEFEAFQMVTHNAKNEKLSRARFSAPPGEHDDGVMALCLLSETLTDPCHAVAGPKPPPRIDSLEFYEHLIDQPETASRLLPSQVIEQRDPYDLLGAMGL